MAPLRTLFVALACVVACVPNDPDLEGRPCPCVEGYRCVDDACTRVVDSGIELIDGGMRLDGRRPFDSGPGFDAGPLFDGGPDVNREDGGIRADVGPDMDSGPEMDGGPSFDAGPMDGGPAEDAGPPPMDAGPAGSFCDRNGSGRYACLDFDDAPSGAWTPFTANGGTVALDSARAVNGRSLRVNVGVEAQGHYERINVGNVSSGRMWLRTRLYVAPGDENDNPYLPLFSMSQRLTEPYSYFSVALAGGDGRLRSVISRGALGYVDDTSSSIVRGGRWLCIEVRLDATTTTDVVTYLDGTEITRFTADATGTWDRIHVGADQTGAGQMERTFWLDDFIWSSTRVGCGVE